jgi:hypothetical protein
MYSAVTELCEKKALKRRLFASSARLTCSGRDFASRLMMEEGLLTILVTSCKIPPERAETYK